MLKRQTKPEEEISLKEVLDKIGIVWRYLLSKWLVILLVGLIGAGIGFTYALLQPVRYISKLSFVVEDTKASGGGLAALAGQFGFDMGGGSGGGIFAGDNILLFLRSESLCRETFLTNYDSAGKITLADKYIQVNGWSEKWSKDKEVGRAISFAKYKDGNFPRQEDSLMQLVVKELLAKELTVGKPDKKASFIEVSVATRDELLSKFFGERLVKIATDRYVDSKTKVKALNVERLQKRADSLGALVNSRTYSAAAAQQSLVDINPGLRMAPVTTEITTREKTIAATVFGEVIKNLEVAKVALSQETPVIQMVDQSSLPLERNKAKRLISMIGGGAMAGFFCIAFLLLRRWWKKQINTPEKETTAVSA
ncbi:MAG TPA: hypothetical protein VHN59_14495 [Chitinophagaceae bacterium]|nr:hypothetical protein [Chitinophagaceae bacterium]